MNTLRILAASLLVAAFGYAFTVAPAALKGCYKSGDPQNPICQDGGKCGDSGGGCSDTLGCSCVKIK